MTVNYHDLGISKMCSDFSYSNFYVFMKRPFTVQNIIKPASSVIYVDVLVRGSSRDFGGENQGLEMCWPNQAVCAVNSMIHHALTRMGTWWMIVLMYTHTHTEQIELCMWSISVSLPHCESLAIPDAGWSAEPAWPETIRDPRGGCTSQWALRPWLKHQLLSMQRWREEKEREGRDHKKRWRNWEFSSISRLC